MIADASQPRNVYAQTRNIYVKKRTRGGVTHTHELASTVDASEPEGPENGAGSTPSLALLVIERV